MTFPNAPIPAPGTLLGASDPHNPGPDRNPALAHVVFSDDKTLGPVIVLRDINEDLPILLKASLSQLQEQEVELGAGTWLAALVFQAVGRGCHVDILPPPPGGHAGMQMSSIFHPEAAFGGVGWVIVNVTSTEVLTYGGRGFAAIRPSAPYQPTSFDLKEIFALLSEEPEKGPEPETDLEEGEGDAPNPTAAELLADASPAPKKKTARKKKKKKTARKKAAKGRVIQA